MKKTIAEDLLKIKAVFLRPNEPFTWASGIKSPIYCDNRLTLSDTQVIEGSGGKTVQLWCVVLSCERKRQRGERQRRPRKVVSFSAPFFQSFLNPFPFLLAREG